MAFIPLIQDTKLKGKAVIDGIGSRVGKSGGSLIHQMLLMCCSTLGASAPYVAAFLFVVIVLWMTAVRALGKQFETTTKAQLLSRHLNKLKDIIDCLCKAMTRHRFAGARLVALPATDKSSSLALVLTIIYLK